MTETLKENELDESIGILKKKKEYLEKKLDDYKVKIGWLFSIMFFGGLLGYALSSSIDYSYNEYARDYYTNLQIIDRRISHTIIGIILAVFSYGYIVFYLKTLNNNRLRNIEYKLVQYGAEKLQDSIEDNFFTKLVKINFKYIDQYYLQTQEQADKSFRLASTASTIGLIIIIIGIVMMFFEKNNPAYVTTAAGLISEFIAAVFFYLYNKTLLKMSQYHQKLVITQNISLALKITEDMSNENKQKVQELIIDRLTFDINRYLSFSEEKN